MKSRTISNLKTYLTFLSPDERRIAARLKKCRKPALYNRYVKAFANSCGEYVRQDIKDLQRLNGGRIRTILAAGILARQYNLSLKNICDVLGELNLAQPGLYEQQLTRCSVLYVYRQVDLFTAHLETGGQHHAS